MRWSTTSLFLALAAVPVLLASSEARAAGPESCLLVTAKSCQYVLSSGGCETQCTPGNFVASCDVSCSASASVSCTGTCEANCKTKCTPNPPVTFCVDECQTDCDASCQGSCSDSACTADCQLDCTNRCQVDCVQIQTGDTCDTQCQASCNASCQVQANIMCHAGCTSSGELPSCQTACQSPSGALFCDGQYVDLEKATQDCLDYLKSQGVSVTTSTTCTASANGSNCTSSATVGCSAAPYVAAAGDRWGALGITGLMVGLGLAVSRRRRR